MTIKICSVCGDPQPIENFNFRNRAKGTRHGYCRECGKLKTRKDYALKSSAYKARASSVRTRIREYIRQVKSKPCTDCGISYPYYVMDFDHYGNKSFNLSVGYRKGFLQVKAEIEKCEVVCANCHRTRTHKRLTGG